MDLFFSSTQDAHCSFPLLKTSVHESAHFQSQVLQESKQVATCLNAEYLIQAFPRKRTCSFFTFIHESILIISRKISQNYSRGTISPGIVIKTTYDRKDRTVTEHGEGKLVHGIECMSICLIF